ncbi:MAG: hypothetical protein ACFFB7_08965, partial [Candidatus Sifarchaeia archaeon]
RAFLTGLRDGSISTLRDAENIYEGCYSRTSYERDFSRRIMDILRELLVKIVSRDMQDIDSPLSAEDLVRMKVRIDAMIDEFERTSPYESLPDSERDIFVDIDAFLDSGKLDFVRQKMQLLAERISFYDRTIMDLKKIIDAQHRTNRWTKSIAIIGVVATIVFGLLTFLG